MTTRIFTAMFCEAFRVIRTRFFFSILLAGSCIASFSAGAVEEYRFERLWPKLEQPWYFNQPRDLVVHPLNGVYVADAGHDRVVQFTADGAFIRSWGGEGTTDGLFNQPYGLALGADGSVWVADTYNHRIQHFSADGSFLDAWGEYGINPGQMYQPERIIVDPDGSLHVWSWLGAQIQHFAADGTFIGNSAYQTEDFRTPGNHLLDDGSYFSTDPYADSVSYYSAIDSLLAAWKSSGSEEGQFNLAIGLAVAPDDGSVYVVDQYNHRVQRFDATGTLLDVLGGEGSDPGQFFIPEAVAVGPDGSVYVADSNNHRIQRFNSSGQLVGLWGGSTTYMGQTLLYPQGVAVAPDKTVYVSNTYMGSVLHFSASGTFLDGWGSEGGSNGQFSFHRGLAVAANGDVYVADSGNNRIQYFNAAGNFLGAWGSYGSGDGQFNWPASVAIGPQGTVFVADSFNGRIQEFTSGGSFIRSIGASGSEPGLFKEPSGVGLSAGGLLYVADTFNNRVQTFDKADNSRVFYKAILLAGGGPSDAAKNFTNNIWDATERIVHLAYDALRSQGLQSDEIRYLHPRFDTYNADGNSRFGVMLDSTRANLQSAITQWATDAEQVYIYLADHGGVINGTGTFRLNPDEVLSGDELNDWVASLEQGLSGQVTVIIEACNSGAFLPNLSERLTCSDQPLNLTGTLAGGSSSYCSTQGITLGPGLLIPANATVDLSAPSISALPSCEIQPGAAVTMLAKQTSATPADKPIVLASAAANEPAYIGQRGSLTFSYFFWNQIRNGDDLNTAWDTARNAMSAFQTVQLDADGDGSSTKYDLSSLTPYCLGKCTRYASDSPVISQAMVTAGSGDQATLSMDVSTLVSLSSAWAMIQPPDFSHPDSSLPVTDLPEVSFDLNVDCSYSGGVYHCSRSYLGFDTSGSYTVSFFAMNRDYEPALPQQAIYQR